VYVFYHALASGGEAPPLPEVAVAFRRAVDEEAATAAAATATAPPIPTDVADGAGPQDEARTKKRKVAAMQPEVGGFPSDSQLEDGVCSNYTVFTGVA
jgi:hypothetical protein